MPYTHSPVYMDFIQSKKSGFNLFIDFRNPLRRFPVPGRVLPLHDTKMHPDGTLHEYHPAPVPESMIMTVPAIRPAFVPAGSYCYNGCRGLP